MRYLSLIFLIIIVLVQTGCSTDPLQQDGPMKFPGEHNPQTIPDALPQSEPLSQYGNPEHYDVYGKRYYVKRSSKDFKQQGLASWYGKQFHGRKTSSGEIYDMFAMTAAHKTLPLPSYVKVTNQLNGLSSVVRINDRGPFYQNRIIDLSYAAALKLEITKTGTAQVLIEAIDPNQQDKQNEQPLQEVSIDQVIIQPLQKNAPQQPAPQSQYVQLGVFSEKNNATRLQNKVMNSSLPTPEVVSVKINNTDFYRVLIGPLTTEKQILAIKYQLNQMGIQSTLITAAALH